MLEKAHALQAERIATQEIHQQQIADADAAALEIEGNRREAQAAISTTKVVAGEAGAFGLSYEGLIGEFSRAQAEFEQAIDTNLAIKNQFAMLNLESTALGTRARIANAQTPSLPRPNYANIMIRGLGSGFQIGSSARAAGVNEVFS
ncbi:MAG: hypothetical protein GY701_28765 [Sulfitobacter sp.]|nr:hypothetical protein [Sulfitobacter sp.]